MNNTSSTYDAEEVNKYLTAELARRDEERADLLAKNKELHGLYAEQVNKRVCLEGELRRRDEIIARLKEDGERLSHVSNVETDDDGTTLIISCPYCLQYGAGNNPEQAIADFGEHFDTCPVTLHRALMKEVE